ncbi:MAG TPA: hypothetical protein VL882_19160 [Vicinamibacterales bacterium]|nr:hypothetical protein [Vicinamibacterales bacterium]
MNSNDARTLLRHTVATVAYRGGKAVRSAPAGFAEFKVGDSSRTPGQILAHIGDLYDWALTMADGPQRWHNSTPLAWDDECTRFFAALRRFDERLANDTPLACAVEQLFQGPVADSLAHIGQIAMLRRLAGAPVRAENYAKADIAAGRVGSEQTAPRVEFD